MRVNIAIIIMTTDNQSHGNLDPDKENLSEEVMCI